MSNTILPIETEICKVVKNLIKQHGGSYVKKYSDKNKWTVTRKHKFWVVYGLDLSIDDFIKEANTEIVKISPDYYVGQSYGYNGRSEYISITINPMKPILQNSN